MTDIGTAAGNLVGRLVYQIEDAPRTLHRDEPAGRCVRLELGLVNSKPEDCDCGLEELLAEAREFMAGLLVEARLNSMSPLLPSGVPEPR